MPSASYTGDFETAAIPAYDPTGSGAMAGATVRCPTPNRRRAPGVSEVRAPRPAMRMSPFARWTGAAPRISAY